MILFVALIVTCVGASIPDHRYQLDPQPFGYGVASGDPLHDSVLLWTRVNDELNVTWAIWEAGVGSFENNVTSGSALATPDTDYTITVEAFGLSPRTRYEYQFRVGGSSSRVGRTLTAPHPSDNSVESFKIATFSCACHWCGFLNSYREIAEDDTIDLVIGLGDYIYNMPFITNSAYSGCVRVPTGLCFQGRCKDGEDTIDVEDIPPQNCTGFDFDRLQERRQDMWHYHKILNTDVDVRALRASHPMIILPDNHDIDGEDTTNFTQTPALQAWLDYVPSRYNIVDGEIFLPYLYRYGSLLDVVRLDTRNIGREEDPPTYLGQKQIQFLEQDVFGPGNITNGWRVVATSQVFMPWSITEDGYRPVLASLFVAFTLPLIFFIGVCAFVRYRRHNERVGELMSGNVDSKSKLENETKLEIARRYSYEGAKGCGLCCTSKYCIAITAVITISMFGILGYMVSQVIEFTSPPEDSVTGVANIQSTRGSAWDGDENPIDRAELLAQMKRLNATNNIFISGDMHISLAANVIDDAPGIGPKETIPDEATRFGVEFLSSSVSKANLDERVEREVGGLTPYVTPLIQWLFESTFLGSNPHFRYFETVSHGYGLITITPEQAVFEWRWQDFSVAGAESYLGKRMTMQKDNNEFD